MTKISSFTELRGVICGLLGLGLLPGAAWATDTPSDPSPQTVDVLNEALPILETKYADFKALQYKDGDHLSDLIARSGGRISLVPQETDAKAPFILTADLPNEVLYWRLASFTPEKDWTTIARQLEVSAPSATGIVLDLRSNLAPDDYRGAAQVLSFFAQSDPTLASFQADSSGYQTAKGEYHMTFHAPVMVLINNQTMGAAEVLAACLKADGALLIGRPTAGKVGVFDEQKLTSGEVLRYFVSPVLPDQKASHHSLLWDQPVAPDIDIAVSDHVEKGALMLIRDNRIQEVIQESAKRDRMSEASLVQGQDPEWDAYLASLEKKTDDHYMQLPPIHDPVLVAALDSLKAIQLSQHPAAATPIAALPQVSGSVQ